MTGVRSALSSSLPPREAALLLAHVLGTSREWILAHPEAQLSPEQQAQFESLIAQAQSGTPLPYLLGAWEFFGLRFRVTPAVLIPRPETELLVETALANSKLQTPNSKIADIGTGSGIVAVTLAVNLPSAEITAIDVSAEALEVAKENALAHRVADRITFIQSDLFSNFKLQTPNSKLQRMSFDLICANLPYIATEELRTLPVAEHEPTLALDGGADGLRLVERLLAEAGDYLSPNGALLAEIGAGQAEAAIALARRYFPAAESKVMKDLAGLDRLLIVNLKV
ncbi:MAG: peptide chain release factor N(5)-glutamine methyltransferase [Chloroflexota bacterium]